MNRPDEIAALADEGCCETPLSHHVTSFWNLLKTETVHLSVNIRRVIGHDAPAGATVYYDCSTFSDEVAKELVRLSATSPGDAVREALIEALAIRPDDERDDNKRILDALKILRASPTLNSGTVLIKIPAGYASAKDFANDCGFEIAALAPAEKAGDEPQAYGNVFERHPALAREIERMASTGNTGSLLDWQRFTDALNAALVATPTPPGDEVRMREALEKINEVRNSIIGTQSLNWSEHVYPLVAALQAAGFEGMEYPAAREYYGTLVERAVKAEDALAALASAEKAGDDAMKHLANVLVFGSAIHPDDRNAAYENALSFFNSKNPDLQIDGKDYATLRTYDPQFATPTPPSADVDKAILSFARKNGRCLNLTRDVGPYEVTEPTFDARQFAELIQSAAPGGGTKSEAAGKRPIPSVSGDADREQQRDTLGVTAGETAPKSDGGVEASRHAASRNAPASASAGLGRPASGPSDPAQEPQAVAPLREARPSIPEDGFNCIWLMENGHQVGCLNGAQNEPAVIARAQHWSRPVSLDREAIARIIDPAAWSQQDRIGRFATYVQGIGPSLEKADAIIALSNGEKA